MNSVLGLAISRSAAGLVVVDERNPANDTLDHDAVLLHADDAEFVQQVEHAVLRMHKKAAVRGYPLSSIRLTWNDETDSCPPLLLDTFADSSITDVTNVQFSSAVDNMTRRLGHANMAVCVLEPD